MAEFGHDPIGYHKSVIRPVAILAVAMCLRAENPIENTGKPMRLPFECTEADTQAASLNCSEQEPCAVFLELSSVEAAGNKGKAYAIADPGNVDPDKGFARLPGTLSPKAIQALASQYSGKGVSRFGLYESTEFTFYPELRHSIRAAAWVYEPGKK